MSETTHKYIPPAVRRARSSPQRPQYQPEPETMPLPQSRPCEIHSDSEDVSIMSSSHEPDIHRTGRRVQSSPHKSTSGVRRSKSYSPRRSSRDVPLRLMQHELARQKWWDDEVARSRQKLNEKKGQDEILREQTKQDLLKDVEQEIQKKLQPLLDKAQEITDKHNEIQKANLPSRSNDPTPESDKPEVGTNGNLLQLLANGMSGGVDEDDQTAVVEDEHHMNDDDDLDKGISKYPELQQLVTRLTNLEKEKDKIIKNQQAGKLEKLVPNKAMTAMTRTYKQLDESEGAIIFTKGPKELPTASTLKPQHVNKKERLVIGEDALKNIQDNLARFERHLKRISHQAVGKFDPWKLVEEVADDILDQCLQEVAEELGTASDEIVYHMYASEFSLPFVSEPFKEYEQQHTRHGNKNHAVKSYSQQSAPVVPAPGNQLRPYQRTFDLHEPTEHNNVLRELQNADCLESLQPHQQHKDDGNSGVIVLEKPIPTPPNELILTNSDVDTSDKSIVRSLSYLDDIRTSTPHGSASNGNASGNINKEASVSYSEDFSDTKETNHDDNSMKS